MPEQPAGLTPITAEMLADQLAELSRLRAEFAQTKRECVGAKDSVSEPEFEAWQMNFGQPCETIDREPTAVEIRGHLPPFAR